MAELMCGFWQDYTKCIINVITLRINTALLCWCRSTSTICWNPIRSINITRDYFLVGGGLELTTHIHVERRLRTRVNILSLPQ